MRLSTMVRWTLVAAVIGWMGSLAVSSVARYLEINDVVEREVVDARPLRAEGHGGPAAFARQVRRRVAALANRPDAALNEEQVNVAEGPRGLKVTVNWSQPVVTYRGQTMWALPLAVTRTFSADL